MLIPWRDRSAVGRRQLGPGRAILAVEPDVQEDRAARDRGEDERCALADADCEHAEPQVQEEPQRPEEGRDPLVDTGWSEMERHRGEFIQAQDYRRAPRPHFPRLVHKRPPRVWKML